MIGINVLALLVQISAFALFIAFVVLMWYAIRALSRANKAHRS